MKLTDLSVEDLNLVIAFAEIARDECAGRNWKDVESMLTSLGMRTATSPHR